jgi:hypothetical protein
MWGRVDHRLDQLGLILMQSWVWPATLIGAALVVIAAGWILVPGPGEAVTLFGTALPRCPVLEATGLPCSQCGMTRSWIWAARGRFGQAWAYNPSAFVAWIGLVAAGLVGAVRLVRRDPARLRIRWATIAVLAVLWLAFHVGTFALRRQGWNPLP